MHIEQDCTTCTDKGKCCRRNYRGWRIDGKKLEWGKVELNYFMYKECVINEIRRKGVGGIIILVMYRVSH